MISIGAKTPSISLLNEEGVSISLDKYRGSYLVLYTYPKNFTPGCTAEACSFRDQSSAITEFGAQIVGVSTDSVDSHKKFKDRYNLPFTLLSDVDHLLLEELGAWGEKNSFGKKSVGTLRMTYLFDPTGKLIKIWPKVSVQTHGEEIATYLKQISP